MQDQEKSSMKFIGFDGETGSMQPSYILLEDTEKYPKGTLLDGFLRPVKDVESFLTGLHPGSKSGNLAFYVHDNHHREISGLQQNQHTFYIPKEGYIQNRNWLKKNGYEILVPKSYEEA